MNYDSNEFTIANVNVTETSNVVAIAPSGTCIPQPSISTSPIGTNTTVTTTNTSLAPGAIAGIVIGTVAILSILGIGLFFFLRRRRTQRHPSYITNAPETSKPQPYPADPKYNSYAGELPASDYRRELPSEAALTPELPPVRDFRMAQELPS